MRFRGTDGIVAAADLDRWHSGPIHVISGLKAVILPSIIKELAGATFKMHKSRPLKGDFIRECRCAPRYILHEECSKWLCELVTLGCREVLMYSKTYQNQSTHPRLVVERRRRSAEIHR